MTKLQALDALASSSSAAPGERENAARAASALRAKIAAGDCARPVHTDLLDEMFGGSEQSSWCTTTCAGARESGNPCKRRSVTLGFCSECLREGASRWVKPGPCGVLQANGKPCELPGKFRGRCKRHREE